MRTQSGANHHYKNQRSAEQAHLIEALDIEHAVADLRGRHQQQQSRSRRHQGAASPAEKTSIGKHAGALIVVIGDLGD